MSEKGDVHPWADTDHEREKRPVAEPWWTEDGRLRYTPPADCDLRHRHMRQMQEVRTNMLSMPTDCDIRHRQTAIYATDISS